MRVRTSVTSGARGGFEGNSHDKDTLRLVLEATIARSTDRFMVERFEIASCKMRALLTRVLQASRGERDR